MKSNLVRIHLIDKARDVHPMGGCVPGSSVPGVFVTTWWRISEEVARSCIGVEVHLHEAQKLPSFKAGRCTGYFPLEDGYGLLFVNDAALAGQVQAEHWSREQARVYADGSAQRQAKASPVLVNGSVTKSTMTRGRTAAALVVALLAVGALPVLAGVFTVERSASPAEPGSHAILEVAGFRVSRNDARDDTDNLDAHRAASKPVQGMTALPARDANAKVVTTDRVALPSIEPSWITAASDAADAAPLLDAHRSETFLSGVQAPDSTFTGDDAALASAVYGVGPSFGYRAGNDFWQHRMSASETIDNYKDVPPSVPEPRSFALALAGLGVLATTLRLRRAHAKTAR